MKIKIVYFAYLLPNKWEPIVEEQLDSLKQLKLYEEADKIYISLISDDIELEKLKKLINEKYSKIEIKNVFNENVYEYPGLKTIYEIACDKDDEYLLYFHSKGMTSNTGTERKFLFKNTIENYKEYIDEFEKNKDIDIGCAFPHDCGFAYINFFWARSSYIINYCNRPEITNDRYIWEIWIGSQISRKQNVITYSSIIKYNKIKNSDELFSIWSNYL